jgi:nicotinamidase-related amidase
MASKKAEPPILLVIDIQHGMVEGPAEWGPRSTPHFVQNVSQLISKWRSKTWPVLHVHHDDIDDPSNPISASSPTTFAPHASAKPISGEQVFIKHVGSPFVSTELPAVIKTYGHRKIVVIGMDGAQCINNTTRHGADLGYDMVVVTDACSTYGVEGWEIGEKGMGAEETHRAAMGMLSSCAKVTTTEKLMGVLGYED